MDDGILPDKLFDSRNSLFNCVSFPMLSGMTPVSKLAPRKSCSRPIKFPIPGGMEPDILVLKIFSSWRVVDRLANELGSFPANLFQPICSTCSLVQFVNEVRNSHSCSLFASNMLLSRLNHSRSCSLLSVEGTTPLNSLTDMSKSWRRERLVTEMGRAPVNWLPPSPKDCTLLRLVAKSCGRRPCRMFCATKKFWRDDRLYNEGGSTPER